MFFLMLLFVLLLTPPAYSWNLFGPSKPPTPEEKIAQLQQEQAEKPNDPIINYNLGVACYKGNRFEDAYQCFNRTIKNAGKKQALIKQSRYNLANTCYKHTIQMLPKDWEKQDVVDQNILETAIKKTKESIDSYKQFLEQEPEHKAAKTNKEIAEKLLKKLEEKKKEQKDQQQKDQSKQDKQQQPSDSGKSQVENDKKERDKNQSQSGRDNASQQPQEPGTDGKSDKLNQEKAKDKEQDQSNHDTPQQQQPEHPQPSASDGTHPEPEKQQNESESMETRSMRAILENLQSDESAAQKRLLLRKAAQTKEEPQQGQKPW